jgi:hypothetical protein
MTWTGVILPGGRREFPLPFSRGAVLNRPFKCRAIFILSIIAECSVSSGIPTPRN